MMKRHAIVCLAACALTFSVWRPAAATAQDRPSTTSNVVADDEKLDHRIEARLKRSPQLSKEAIDVKVDKGVVTLRGTVKSEKQKAAAEKLARIKGVTSVENYLEVKKADEGFVPKAGKIIDDDWITTKVKAKLAGEDELKDSDIDVKTKDHIITLKGRVTSEAGRARAVEVAKSIEGAAGVVDKLRVSSKR